ncbi:hypothetical protein [Achromobacter deleyi]|uniref:hypothetical protein n=1 Tax=Achromobacter deleyi TaxID=1353891 RepID=UPI001492EB11|nr:hypothetical protein [Achromobacter deleyi]QVQ28268.1 hypothetical protein HLG70_07575 [Achromobacter deleyi]
MATYPQRVRDNILPLSVGSSLPEAFEEWSFTNRTHDHETATEICQLCNQEELRYHFEIKNSLTHHHLWVGSQCILKFNVSVFEQGRKLSSADAKKKLDRLMQQMRLEACIRALERLNDAEPNEILANALTFYKTNKFLTPKFGFVVLWRLQRHAIDHNPSFLKISLKKSRYKDALRAMPLSHVHVLWPALTTAQRNVALAMGHLPPAT